MSVPIPAPTSESVVDHPVPVPPVFPIQDMDLDLNSSGNLENIPLAFHLNGISDVDKALMMDTANNAMDELIRLLQINEPLWIKSSSDGRYTIHRDSYEKIFPRVSHFKTSTSRLESSKCSGMVTMNAMQLVDMFLDSVSFHNYSLPMKHKINLIIY